MKILLCSLCLLSQAVIAAPQRFEIARQEKSYQFSYQFEFSGQPQRLNFTLQQEVLNNHFRQFRAFKPNLVQQYLWRDLRAHVAKYPTARISRLPDKTALSYTLKVSDPGLLSKLDGELKQLLYKQRQYYLRQTYHTELTLPLGETVIVPDHVRFMHESLNDLLPVATALHQKLANTDSRTSLSYISQWIQRIPYQDLSDRRVSDGLSYSPPLKLLRENRGDCDSKTVLLAALLRMLLPDIKLAIIYLPEHAMLAVQLPVTATDMSVTIESREYLLVDPTGPALLAPGEIAPEYRIFTENGQFAYLLF